MRQKIDFIQTSSGFLSGQPDEAPFAFLIMPVDQERAQQLIAYQCDPCAPEPKMHQRDQDERKRSTDTQDHDGNAEGRETGIACAAQRAYLDFRMLSLRYLDATS